ncbi:MAG: hypothetical protein V1904_09395 [Bacteroidota bacterium]
MKKTFIVYILLLIFISGAVAQVDEIKEASNKNDSLKSNVPDGKTNGDDGCLSDACGAACASGCFDWVLEYAIFGIVKLHQFQLEKRNEIPEVVSLELMPHFGYAEPSSSMLLPRIRGNWGLFSTDFRFSNMTEYGTADGTDFLNTIDWQILEFNFVVTKPVIVRLGTGLMYEFHNSNTFMEHFLGIDGTWKDHQYLASAEARIAKDYYTGATPRFEGNLRMNYRIMETAHMDGYAMIGSIYQNCYNSVDVWTAQAGFAFNFH